MFVVIVPFIIWLSCCFVNSIYTRYSIERGMFPGFLFMLAFFGSQDTSKLKSHEVIEWKQE